jgi:hypothetical protein
MISTSKTPVTLRDVKSGTASIVQMSLPTERLRLGISSITNRSKEPTALLGNKREREDVKAETTEATPIPETKTTTETLGLTGEDPPLGKGIAVALDVFRKRGMIGKEFYIGRNNDEVIVNTSTPGKKEINLDYRDENGRLMTSQEAFRYQCHIFHQNAPSKRKQEKALAKQQLEMRNQNTNVSKTPTLRYLKKQQEATNMPYVTLQGKNYLNNI